jgi:tRNA uridine 5-carbamoylmethylation protein Kti12
MKKLVLVIFLFGLIANQSFAQSDLSTEERKLIKEAVEQRSKELWRLHTQDYNEENLKRLMEFFVETEDKSWMGKPAILLDGIYFTHSKEEIEDIFSQVFERRHSAPFKLLENYFAVISEEVVVEIQTIENYIIAKNGNRSPDFEAGDTLVWILSDNAWKILHWHRTTQKKE